MRTLLLVFTVIFAFSSCNLKTKRDISNNLTIENNAEIVKPKKIEVTIQKDFLYDKYTLEDSYPYKDTTRQFQWDKIHKGLILLDSIQQVPSVWGIVQNRKNINGESPLVECYVQNSYNRITDTFGTERYQSAPLYKIEDTTKPFRYCIDGSLVKILQLDSNQHKINTVYFDGEWIIPSVYIEPIPDSVIFKKAIFVDRNNQNIATLEKVDSIWLVRSMNPATTGVHNPPYAHETPLGIFVIQEKKNKMIYLKDGSHEEGGFAPYASRFCNGGYIHGVPVNAPRTELIEYSSTLGTTTRSHMCVRNATSHAEFVYDWAPIKESIVFVIE